MPMNLPQELRALFERTRRGCAMKLIIEYEIPDSTTRDQAAKLVAKKYTPLKWITGYKLEQVGPTEFKKVGVATIITAPR